MNVRSILLAAATTVVMGTAAVPAFAADIDDVRVRQQERIREGFRSGQLTRHELVNLEQEQSRIDGLIRRARADGRIDPYERREIEDAQAVASRHIFAEKHDVETRRHHRWGWWHRTAG